MKIILVGTEVEIERSALKIMRVLDGLARAEGQQIEILIHCLPDCRRVDLVSWPQEIPRWLADEIVKRMPHT